MKKATRNAAIFLSLLILLFFSLFKIDLVEPEFDQELLEAGLNEIKLALATKSLTNPDTLKIGFSKVSITPKKPTALAGYGKRSKDFYSDILDSVFVRTIVLQTDTEEIGIIACDLLIVPPAVMNEVENKLSNSFRPDQLFFTATHTHASIGQWQPGVVGSLIAGDYSKELVDFLAQQIVESVLKAEQELQIASFGFNASNVPKLIKNRLVGQRGITDETLKTLHFKTSEGNALFSTYSAHATMLGQSNNQLSADYPGVFNATLEQTDSIAFSAFAAGAVASMGYSTPSDEGNKKSLYGKLLAQHISSKTIFNDSVNLSTKRVAVRLPKPKFKVAQGISLRPFWFNTLFQPGSNTFISILTINRTILIGVPCDFSGELAVPLYKYAKGKGYDLVITSFNGGYIGYITDDKWHDLNKYETRAMNWYGFGMGYYFSSLIKKAIDVIDENYKTNSSN